MFRYLKTNKKYHMLGAEQVDNGCIKTNYKKDGW